MTNPEFSSEFEVMLNSYSASPLFGESLSPVDVNLNEYEKSVFLTKAQESLLVEVYNGTYNKTNYESLEEHRRYLNPLIKTAIGTPASNHQGEISTLSYPYSLPQDVWFILLELVSLNIDSEMKDAIVVPTTQDEYYKVTKNPFRWSNKRRVLRLDKGDNSVELISKYPIGEYKVRYLSKPAPIILEDLTNHGLTINGIATESTCSLPEALHREILERAVILALTSKYRNVANK